MQVDFKFNFDDLVKDVVSGLEGKVVCVDYWRNGCKRYGIQPKGCHQGEAFPISWVDESQAELMLKGKKVESKLVGGPRPSNDSGTGK